MELGAFSISLAVKDLSASLAFYEKLGFAAVGGDIAQHWLILRNGGTTIGLFEGMFDLNTLTFNPGWDASGNTLDGHTDVRDLQQAAEDAGLEPTMRVEGDSGPGFFVLMDPDGNPVLIDQHVG